MGRKVTLYIGGQRADMDDRSPILFNYAREELDNPTVVRNSYTRRSRGGRPSWSISSGGGTRPPFRPRRRFRPGRRPTPPSSAIFRALTGP